MKPVAEKNSKELAGDIILMVNIFGEAKLDENGAGLPDYTFKDTVEGLTHVIRRIWKAGHKIGVAVDTYVPQLEEKRRFHPSTADDRVYMGRDGLITTVKALLAYHKQRMDNQNE